MRYHYKLGDICRKRKGAAAAGLLICMLFMLLRFRSTKIAIDNSVFSQVDEKYAGHLITETRSPVIDYEECSSDQTVFEFAVQHQIMRRAVSVKAFESFDGKPARRGLVANEAIAENQVRTCS
jgi:hypothetical protein